MLGLKPVDDPAIPRMVGADAQRAVGVAMRVTDATIIAASCLPRALVLERALAAHRVPGEVVIGVNRQDGFRAHAWVEVAGSPVGALDAQSPTAWEAIVRLRSAKARRLIAKI